MAVVEFGLKRGETNRRGRNLRTVSREREISNGTGDRLRGEMAGSGAMSADVRQRRGRLAFVFDEGMRVEIVGDIDRELRLIGESIKRFVMIGERIGMFSHRTMGLGRGRFNRLVVD